jgi:hypothetical protein
MYMQCIVSIHQLLDTEADFLAAVDSVVVDMVQLAPPCSIHLLWVQTQEQHWCI